MKSSLQYEDMCFELQSDINNVGANCFQLWYTYVDIIKFSQKKVTQDFQSEYFEKIKDRWCESIFRTTRQVSDLGSYSEDKIGKKNYSIAQ